MHKHFIKQIITLLFQVGCLLDSQITLRKAGYLLMTISSILWRRIPRQVLGSYMAVIRVILMWSLYSPYLYFILKCHLYVQWLYSYSWRINSLLNNSKNNKNGYWGCLLFHFTEAINIRWMLFIIVLTEKCLIPKCSYHHFKNCHFVLIDPICLLHSQMVKHTIYDWGSCFYLKC